MYAYVHVGTRTVHPVLPQLVIWEEGEGGGGAFKVMLVRTRFATDPTYLASKTRNVLIACHGGETLKVTPVGTCLSTIYAD